MKHLALALLCACLAVPAWAGSKKPKTRVVDGETVIAGPAFKATPLVDVRDLKFYACTLERNGADCSIVAGYIVSHMAPQRQYVVTVDIDMYEVYGATISLQHRGTARAVIDRPKAGQPTKFVALGPPWYGEHARGKALKPAAAHHVVRVTVQRWKPPRPDPVVPGK